MERKRNYRHDVSLGIYRKKGAWISFDEDLLSDLKKSKIDCPEKIQGDQKLLELIESNINIRKHFETIVRKIFNEEK